MNNKFQYHYKIERSGYKSIDKYLNKCLNIFKNFHTSMVRIWRDDLEIYLNRKEKNSMKKTYQIEVDCAACALKMEEAAKKTEGVADAVVSFMTQKMNVEFAEGADEKKVMKAVAKACKKVEPDCEIEF